MLNTIGSEKTNWFKKKHPKRRYLRQVQEENDIPDNIVIVGSKNPIHYAIYAMSKLNEGYETVSMLARGRAMSIALEAALMVREMLNKDVEIKDIVLSSDMKKGNTRASVEIILTNPFDKNEPQEG